MPAMWPTCLTRRRRPSSSKRLPPPHTAIGSNSQVNTRWKWLVRRRSTVEKNDPSGSILLQRRMVMNQHVKNVVLVHGAFADGSGWEAVANILKNDGYKVSVP